MTKTLKYNLVLIALKFGTASSVEGKAENKQGGVWRLENHGKFWETHPENTLEKYSTNQPTVKEMWLYSMAQALINYKDLQF